MHLQSITSARWLCTIIGRKKQVAKWLRVLCCINILASHNEGLDGLALLYFFVFVFLFGQSALGLDYVLSGPHAKCIMPKYFSQSID